MEFVVILICLVVNAILAAVEMSFVTVTKARLRELSRTGNRDAARALVLRSRPERTLSVLQIGITAVGSVAAAAGGVGAAATLAPYLEERYELSAAVAEALALAALVGPLTCLNVVVGELVPKSLALRDPLKIALWTSRYVTAADRALSPVVDLLENSTRWILKLIPSRGEKISEASETVELGLLSRQAREYVINLVDLEKKRIRDVRLGWEQAVYVRTSNSAKEVEAVVHESGHTRLPVLENDQVIGILNTKEFFVFLASGHEDWTRILRPAVNVSDSAPILRALRSMQESRSHLSVTYDNGLKTGIVTIEDILEEVIGDLYDEDDDDAIEAVLHAKDSPK